MSLHGSILIPMLLWGLSAAAQSPPPNPVFVNDSNEARRLLDQARELAPSNPDEAVRLIQSVLDEQRGTVVEDRGEPGRFVSTRSQAHDLLRSRPTLLEVYGRIENRRAAELRAEGRNRALLDTRALTPAGLGAVLEAGQDQLEQGNLAAASGWLEEGRRHPDLDDDQRRRVLAMLALTHYAAGDDERFRSWREQLTGAGPDAQAWVDLLADWTRAIPPTPRIGRDTSEGSNELAGELLTPPMWTVDYLRTPENVNRAIGRPEDERQLLDSGRLTTVLPVVQGEAVFFNEGGDLARVDLLTGVEQWRRPLLAPEEQVGQTADPIGPTALAVTDEDVVAWIGFSLPGGTSETEEVVCLDADTGEERWRFDLRETPGIDLPQSLYPASPPVIHDNLIFLLMRRDSRQGLKSEYLLALDRLDGTPVFRTYLASTGSQVRDGSLRPLTKPLVAGHRIIVASSIGAIAAVNQATGQVDWVQRMDTPVGGTQALSSIRPYDFNLPLVLDDQIISLSPDFRSVVQLDLESGRMRTQLRIDDRLEWNGCRYLLTDGRLIFAIGSAISAFDPRDLSRVVWSTQPRRTGEGQGQPLAGRVHVAPDRLYVPTGHALVELDSRTGQVTRRLPMDQSGLPRVADGHLLFSGPRSLSFHADARTISDTLAGRLTGNQDDLPTRVALARASARTGDQRSMMQRVQEVIDRLEEDDGQEDDRSERLRALLFDEVASTLEPNGSIPAEERREMVSLLDRLTRNTPLEPSARLALGDWVAPGDLPAAVDWWQDLPAASPLGETLIWNDEVLAPASFWADQRLRRAYREDASLAPASPVRGPETSDPWSRRIASLAAAIRTHPPANTLPATLMKFFREAGDAGRGADGLAILDLWQNVHPDAEALPPPASSESWTAELTAAARPVLPRGPHSGRSQHWVGILVDDETSRGSIPTAPRSFVRSRNGVLIYHAAPDYQPRWEVEVPHRQARVVHQDDELVILRLETLGQVPRLRAFHVADGSTAWERRLSDSLFRKNTVAAAQPGIVRRHPVQQTGEVSVQTFDAGLVLVQHSGRIMGLDPADGTPRWRAELPGFTLFSPIPWQDGIAAIAYARSLLEESGPDPEPTAGDLPDMMLVWFEAATGTRRVIPLPPELGEPAWIQSNQVGQLAVRGTSGLALFSSPESGLQWLTRAWPLPSLQSLGNAIVTPRAVLLTDRTNLQHAFSLETGERLPEDRSRGTSNRTSDPELIAGGDRVWIRHSDSIDILDSTGARLGSDVISQTQGQSLTAVAPFADGLAVVADQRGVFSTQPGRRGSTQRRHLLYLLSPEGRTEEIIELFNLSGRISTARAVDGRLVLGSDEEVLVIDLPAPAGSGPADP